MKGISFSLIITILLFTSCKQQHNISPQPVLNDTTYVTHSNENDNYILYGATDFRIKMFSTVSYNMKVILSSAKQEKITLSLQDLPENITAKYSPATGYAGFNTRLTLSALNVQPGKHPVKIVATSENGTSKVYNVDVEVDLVQCDTFLSNHLNTFRTEQGLVATGSVVYGSSNLEKDIHNPGRYYFSSIYLESNGSKPIISYASSTDKVACIFDCDNNTVTIPEVTVDGYNNSAGVTEQYIVSGYGTINYKEKKINITYTAKKVQGVTYTFIMYADIQL